MAENIKVFNTGDIICKEGAYELWMYEILSGSVSIYKDYSLPTQEKIATVKEGLIGEMGLINSLPRVATVVADAETKLALIGEDDFSEYCKDPDKASRMFICLTERLRQINATYTEACETVRDYLDAEEKNAPKSNALTDAMKRFAAAFRR